jgi:3-methyl-2-oxobutanoate hydroxymethyltransferase
MSHHNSDAAAAGPRKKVTVLTLQTKKRKRKPITMMTAYDYPSALLADQAGSDMLLVGDSLAQVVLGLEDTVSVTMEEMLHHCRAVARGAQAAFTVGDMPFMSYQGSRREAVRNAGRFLKEGRMQSVKLEGGSSVASTVRAITRAGIPVVGHIGFTPQSVSSLGGYRIQGKSADSAQTLFNDAFRLQQAGAIAIVLELVPERVATLISERLDIPTIGIGAGAGCDGQVLVYHDVLGMLPGRQPRFVKRYAELETLIPAALAAWGDDVAARSYPGAEHTYPIEDAEYDRFVQWVKDFGDAIWGKYDFDSDDEPFIF